MSYCTIASLHAQARAACLDLGHHRWRCSGRRGCHVGVQPARRFRKSKAASSDLQQVASSSSECPPTIAETSVLKDYEAAIWTGSFSSDASRNSDQDRSRRSEAIKEPALIDRLAAVGVQTVGMSASEMRAHIQAELDRVSNAAKEANIRLE